METVGDARQTDIPLPFLAVELLLDLFALEEKGFGRQIGLHFAHGVQKQRLVGHKHGLGLVQLSSAQDLAEVANLGESLVDVLVTVSCGARGRPWGEKTDIPILLPRAKKTRISMKGKKKTNRRKWRFFLWLRLIASRYTVD